MGTKPSSISRIPLAIALRDSPQARRTKLTPPWPNALASLAAIIRRVRSSNRGHTERNFSVNSVSVSMHVQHSITNYILTPLFIYSSLAEERARNRQQLLQATELELEKIVQATQRPKRRFKGKDRIALRVGKVLNRYKVGKHFVLEIGEESFSYQRRQERIEQEAALDGIYVIRTNLAREQMDAEQTVAAYKGLSVAERAFRSCKSVDLKVRPIYHHLEDRVRAHVFLCMLAYYVEWHMRQKLAPILFDDEDPEAGRQLRDSVVAPSQRSPQALRKAHRKRTVEGGPVHSFQTLLSDLATISKNRIQPQLPGSAAFDKITRPTSLQQRALDLLGVRL